MGMAQGDNAFLDRAFWKTSPSVGDVKQKIEQGNDPTAATSANFDGVVYAILENAPLETVKYLLSLKGNEVTKITHDGRNYLMWASYNGDLELVKLLVALGSDTKILDDRGNTVLTFTAGAGQLDPNLYQYILSQGGSIMETNHNGANALHLLVPHIKDLSQLDYFIDKGLDLNSVDLQGNTLFNYAARMGNIAIMDQLIATGMDPAALNEEGANAMVYASYGGRGHTNPLSVYEYLHGKNVAANVVTKDGVTPLHGIASRTADTAVVDFFLDKGVDVNQVDAEGNTSFLNAVAGNNLEIAHYLFPKVEDIDHTNNGGHSALTLALGNKAGGFFDFLLSKGADATLVDKDGNTLAYHAFKAYDTEKSAHFLSTLKDRGVDLAQDQGKGNTLFHLAVSQELPSLIDKAVELGVDIDKKNQDGLTPLHLAAMKSKDGSLLQALIAQGADKSILTDFEESALDLARENELLSKNGVALNFLEK